MRWKDACGWSGVGLIGFALWELHPACTFGFAGLVLCGIASKLHKAEQQGKNG